MARAQTQTTRSRRKNPFVVGLLSLAAIIVAGLLIWGAVHLAKQLPKIGAATTAHKFSANSFVVKLSAIVLGIDVNGLTIESLILHLAIFLIIFIAVSDIIEGLSTFSQGVAWTIGFAIALVAGVTKIIAYLAGLFGIVAGIGALGVALIAVSTIVAAVILNFGVGGPLRKWRQARQKEIDEFKAETGRSAIIEGVRTLGATGRATRAQGS